MYIYIYIYSSTLSDATHASNAECISIQVEWLLFEHQDDRLNGNKNMPHISITKDAYYVSEEQQHIKQANNLDFFVSVCTILPGMSHPLPQPNNSQSNKMLGEVCICHHLDTVVS